MATDKTPLALDEILEELNGSRFEQVLSKVPRIALYLANRPGAENIPAIPSLYPAIRLVQAFGLTGANNYAEASKVISTEMSRITLSETRRYTVRDNPDLDTVLALHVGLAVHGIREYGQTRTPGFIPAEAFYEKCADQISRRIGTDLDQMLYARAIFNQIAERVLGSGLAVHVAKLNFQDLLGRLNRMRNHLVVPIRDADVYAMPPRAAAGAGGTYFFTDFIFPPATQRSIVAEGA